MPGMYPGTRGTGDAEPPTWYGEGERYPPAESGLSTSVIVVAVKGVLAEPVTAMGDKIVLCS